MAGTPYRLENRAGCWSLKLEAPWQDLPWTEVERTGETLVQQLREIQPDALVVDLSDLTYINSSSVAFIVRVWKSVRTRGAQMVLINRREGVREILNVAGLDQIWTIVEDYDAARSELGLTGLRRWGRAARTLLSASAVLAALAAAAGYGLLLGWSKSVDVPTVAGAVCGATIVAVLAGLGSAICDRGLRRRLGIAVSVVAVSVGVGVGLTHGETMAAVLGMEASAEAPQDAERTAEQETE